MKNAALKPKNEFVIGVLGGMGTYATINMFRQYAAVFEAEKEWDRPRILIDNNCTMPSRVRAILYGENFDTLVDQMTNSINFLIQAGATRILLACNTSHFFLDSIYEKLPAAKNYVLNILENCAEYLRSQQIDKLYLMASEGTLQSGIYSKTFAQKNINCLAPAAEDFPIMRGFIEAVKQDKISADVENLFVNFITDNARKGGVR